MKPQRNPATIQDSRQLLSHVDSVGRFWHGSAHLDRAIGSVSWLLVLCERGFTSMACTLHKCYYHNRHAANGVPITSSRGQSIQ